MYWNVFLIKLLAFNLQPTTLIKKEASASSIVNEVIKTI